MKDITHRKTYYEKSESQPRGRARYEQSAPNQMALFSQLEAQAGPIRIFPPRDSRAACVAASFICSKLY
jgi:hypothetical protein